MPRRGVISHRAEKKRREQLTKLIWRLGGGVLMLFFAGAIGWQLNSILAPGEVPIAAILVKGLDHNRQSEIAPTVQSYWDKNFLTLDLNEMRQSLLHNPWLSEVNIQRHWPNQIHISAVQRQVFGYWGERRLVDVNGDSFEPSVLPRQRNWPRLQGPVGQEQVVMRAYLRALDLLRPTDLVIEAIRQDARLEWQMSVIAPGKAAVDVVLGRDALAEALFIEQLQRFADAYPRVLRPIFTKVRAVDMRYVKDFAVRWVNNGIQAATSSRPAPARPPAIHALRAGMSTSVGDPAPADLVMRIGLAA